MDIPGGLMAAAELLSLHAVQAQRRPCHRIPRARYRVTNWPANEAGLRRRGDLTLWLEEAALDGRAAPKRSSPGGQPRHSELAIELVPTLRLVFHLALRQAEAFSRSVPCCASSGGRWELCPNLGDDGLRRAAYRGG